MVPGKLLSIVLPRGNDGSVKLDPKVSPAQSPKYAKSPLGLNASFHCKGFAFSLGGY